MTTTSDLAATSTAMQAASAGPMAAKAIAAATIGNLLEWYDFAVYGFFATTLSKLFFPASDPTTSLLLTFATFGVGFLMRPVGALVIGVYGDRRGRKKALMLTMGLMAVGTGAIGLLPTNNQLGVSAAVLLVLARLMQGFSAGGESGGSITFIVECAPSNRRGFFGSFQQATVAAGLLLGSLTATLLTTNLAPSQLQEWGWRIPFLLGVLIAPAGMYLRKQLRDTPAYEAVKSANSVTRTPLLLTLQTQSKQVLQGAGVTLLWSVAYYICFAYLPTYAIRELRISAADAFLANTIALTAVILLSPVMGAISDQIGRKPLLLGSTILFGGLAYPLLSWLGASHDFTTLSIVALSFALFLAMYNGPGPAALSELFPTNVRFTGLSIGYNISAAVFGGFAPFASAYLIDLTGQKVAPAYFLTICALLTLATLVSLKESFRKSISQSTG
jgi:MHS family proline/betaine transporter-like MFS transporter